MSPVVPRAWKRYKKTWIIMINRYRIRNTRAAERKQRKKWAAVAPLKLLAVLGSGGTAATDR